MKIALGMIVRDFISAHPLIDFLDNAETYGHQIDRVIVVYSHSMSRSALFAWRKRTRVSLIELHNYRRAYGEFNKLGVSDKSVDALLYSELLSEHGLIPYGFNRNHVLMEALFEDIDLLIFVDSDVQPRVLKEPGREGCGLTMWILWAATREASPAGWTSQRAIIPAITFFHPRTSTAWTRSCMGCIRTRCLCSGRTAFSINA